MSDIANLLWQIDQLKNRVSAVEAENAALRETVSQLSGRLESILERIMQAVELTVDIQAGNTLNDSYKTNELR